MHTDTDYHLLLASLMVIVTAIFITPLEIKLLLSESMCLLSCETEDSLIQVMFHPAELFHYFLIQASSKHSFHSNNMRRTRTSNLSENTQPFIFERSNIHVSFKTSQFKLGHHHLPSVTFVLQYKQWGDHVLQDMTILQDHFPGKEIYLIFGPFLCTNSGCLSLLNRVLQQKHFLSKYLLCL